MISQLNITTDNQNLSVSITSVEKSQSKKHIIQLNILENRGPDLSIIGEINTENPILWTKID